MVLRGAFVWSRIHDVQVLPLSPGPILLPLLPVVDANSMRASGCAIMMLGMCCVGDVSGYKTVIVAFDARKSVDFGAWGSLPRGFP